MTNDLTMRPMILKSLLDFEIKKEINFFIVGNCFSFKKSLEQICVRDQTNFCGLCFCQVFLSGVFCQVFFKCFFKCFFQVLETKQTVCALHNGFVFLHIGRQLATNYPI